MRFHYQNTHNFEFKEEMIWNEKSGAVIEEGSAHDCEAKISSKSPIISLKTSKLYKSLIDKGVVNNDCDGGEDKSRLTPRSRPASH